jgi:hypothetical protein
MTAKPSLWDRCFGSGGLVALAGVLITAVSVLASLHVGPFSEGPSSSHPPTGILGLNKSNSHPGSTIAATGGPSSPGASAPQPSPIPEGPGSVLYQADWSKGLNGWSGSGDWSTLGGMLVCGGRDATASVGAVAPVDVSSANGYAVEADIQLLRYNPADGSFGLAVRGQENGNGYGFGATTDGTIVLATDQNGVLQDTLDSKPFDPGSNWHRFRIEVSGNTLRAFVDGSLVLNAIDNTFVAGDRVGLWSSGAQLNVRHFIVTAL